MAASLFDVITFCNNAWAWSATYNQRLSLLASAQVRLHLFLQGRRGARRGGAGGAHTAPHTPTAQVHFSGRQVGGKVIPGSAVGEWRMSCIEKNTLLAPVMLAGESALSTVRCSPPAPSTATAWCVPAAARKTKLGAVMMPTEAELLEDACRWVDKWPDAVGNTNMLSSFLMADEHWNADCWCAAHVMWVVVGR